MRVSLLGIESRSREDHWVLRHAIVTTLCDIAAPIQSSVVHPARHRHLHPALIAAEGIST